MIWLITQKLKSILVRNMKIITLPIMIKSHHQNHLVKMNKRKEKKKDQTINHQDKDHKHNKLNLK